MKTARVCLLAFALAVAEPALAGEIYVEIKTSDGEPKEGSEVQLRMEDGEATQPVKTNKEGIAILVWKTEVKKGRIMVDGAPQYAGTIPLRISFKQ